MKGGEGGLELGVVSMGSGNTVKLILTVAIQPYSAMSGCG